MKRKQRYQIWVDADTKNLINKIARQEDRSLTRQLAVIVRSYIENRSNK